MFILLKSTTYTGHWSANNTSRKAWLRATCRSDSPEDGIYMAAYLERLNINAPREARDEWTRVDVAMQFDDAPQIRGTWHVWNNEWIHPPGSDENFIARLKGTDRFSIDFATHDDVPVNIAWKVKGFKDALKPVEETCSEWASEASMPVPTATPISTALPVGSWIIQPDVSTDSSGVEYVYTRTESAIGNKNVVRTLAVKCQKGRLPEVYIYWREPVSDVDLVAIEHRLGNLDATSVISNWQTSTSDRERTYYDRDTLGLVDGIISSEQFKATITTLDAEVITATFDVRYLENAIDSLSSKCSP